MKTKVRDSQFELLRIIAMFFVVTGHLVIKGANTVGLLTPYSVENDGIAGVVLYSSVVGGVNLFVMITGWYGVKNIWKGYVRLVTDCIFFGAVSYLLLLLLSCHPLNIKELIVSMMFITNWFVVSYMMLLLLAPIIEKSLQNASATEMGYWLLLLTIFNLVFGYWLGKVNDNGYNAVQFIWLYYIARFLRITQQEAWNKKLQKYGLWIWIGATLMLAFVFIGMSYMGHTLDTLRWFSYNNPFLMLACIGLFMWISRLKMQSKIVNVIATGMFGVFLLHTTPFVIPFRNQVTSAVFHNYFYFGIFVEAILIMIVCCGISLVLNRVTKPLISTAIGVIDNKLNKH